MKAGFKILVVLVVLAVCAAFSPDASAQWPKYPDQNVPRKADGTIDMDAPAPRMPDGKPDLSGTWENIGRGPGRLPKQELGLDEKPHATFNDVGAGFKDGLPFLPAAKALRDQRRARNSADNPDVWCLPMGNMQFNVHPFPRKMVQTPGLLVMLNEMNAGYRQVFTDGRPLPTDPVPSWQGYSTATWQGDTLVISSIGFRDDLWIDWNGSVITEAAKVQERIRRPDYGHLEIEVTVDDPKAYTRPWTVSLRQQIALNTELVDEICLENEKSLQRMK